jgi:hypothetical protein
MRPFWGEGDGGVPFTAIESGAKDLWKAVPGILAGRPGTHVHERNGYTSRNLDRALIGANCGFTVDGELVNPKPGRAPLGQCPPAPASRIGIAEKIFTMARSSWNLRLPIRSIASL